MKRLYLQIYLTVLASLVAFAVAAGFLWWVYIDQFAPRHPMDVIGEAALALPDGTAPVEKQQQALRRFAERVRGDAALYAPDRSLIAQAGRPLPPHEQGRVFGGRMQGEGGPRAWSMPLADGRWLVARVPREHWRGRRPGPLLLLALAARAGAVQPGEELADPALEARARALSQEIRCLVCQNQSIDESEADLARDLRLIVRERIAAGEDDAQVKAFLVERYGDFVLLDPPVKPKTWLLWFGPAAVTPTPSRT